METKSSEKQNLPYYLHIKNILKEKIQNGWIKDKRLPSIRAMAKEFGVSVNTVLRAYNELGKDGIVSGSVGRGTFIKIDTDELRQKNRQSLLERIVEHALEEALSLEFTIEEFQKAVEDYINEKLEMMQRIFLAFIECNIEQLTYFTDHLELDPHIHRLPILLDELRSRNEETLDKVAKSDIFVTSFYHLKEVQEFLGNLEKPIIGINIEPEVSTLIKIARIPFESTVGIVTTSFQFRKEIREVLEKLGLNFKEIHETNSPESDVVKKIVQKCDAVLVSPKQKKVVAEFARDSDRVIEFVFTPDRTSINNLKLALLELKKKNP
ncbi:MAG: GntR family transcriptional regulator [Spirochaetota bacterium]